MAAGVGAVALEPYAAHAATALAADDLTAFRGIVQSYFQNRAIGITQAGKRLTSADWRQSSISAFGVATDDEAPEILAGGDLARKAHGGYAGAHATVSLTIRSASAHEVVLGVEELTSLGFAGAHPPHIPESRYRLVHEVRLVRDRSRGWLLADARVESDGALPPLTQPRLDRAGRRSAAASAIVGPAAGPASEVAPVHVATRRERLDSVYNHDEMIRYAATWATSRNPDFPDYHNNGGDCTSFVSQIMFRGGWAQIGPPGQSTLSKWFYGSTVNTCSYTWGAAANWHSFATLYAARFEAVSNVYYCQDSDVVQYDWNITADDKINHTQFVSNNYYDEHTVELYMTQHDNDYSYRPLSEILADVSVKYPRMQVYGLTHSVW
ncbi:amidase domain-containing protein [Actinoplanes sp. NPDC089786]|uniref:amidase domain-containing protein n=1 Tax=Actinoplanes sp. NPDC089786 TaxID=3155185 RepID=UPI00343F4CFE